MKERTTWSAAAALLGVAAMATRDAGPAAIGALYVAAVTIPLAVTDARELRLPNSLVLPGYAFAAAGVVWALLARGSPPWTALMAAAAAFSAFAVLSWGGGLGMGDVKLAGVLAAALAAVAAERGPPGEAFAAVAVCFIAALMTAALAAFAEMLPAGGRSTEIALGPMMLGSFWAVTVLC